jgi:ferredoxin
VDINKKRCVGCGNCIPWCTMGVISIGADRKAEVNTDECVECNNCYRSMTNEGLNPTFVRGIRRLLGVFHLSYEMPLDVCPTGALSPPDLKWPRFVRRAFSDPEAPKTSAQFDTNPGAPFAAFGGRGTGEIKANDVTGRLRRGDVGFVIELGRPGLGARIRDFEKVTRALAPLGVTFEPQNPLTMLIKDTTTGQMDQVVLDEKVLSAIIEIRVKDHLVAAVLAVLKEVQSGINTVMSVGIAARCAPDGSVSYTGQIQAAGYSLSLNGKCNVGLGRPLYQEAKL